MLHRTLCIALLFVCVGRLTHGEETPARRVLAATPGSPQIDGVVDDIWQAASRVTTQQPVATQMKLKASEEASYADVQCLWDEAHLYFLFHVQDEKIATSGGAPWDHDSIEILLDENGARTERYDEDDAQYRVDATGAVSCGEGMDGQAVTAAVRTTDKGYIVEARVALQTGQGAVGRKMGLELQVNNDSGLGQRRSLMKWSDPRDESWRDTSQFGTLLLVKSMNEAKEAMANNSAIPIKREESNEAAMTKETESAEALAARVPVWAQDAVFYQIFPERFRNGDSANDPTHASLEFPDKTPESWHITKWTQQWYARDAWEEEIGPDFYEDAVFHRRYGGDLQGILDRLDYVADLGINAIYLNPVFYARSMHKYDGNSYHHIDPHFGPDAAGDFAIMAKETADPATWQWTAADELFLKLIETVHEKGMRIVIDGVFNHTGRDFFAFANLRELQEQSPYKDWYVVQTFRSEDGDAGEATEFTYDGWWGVDTLPVFADTEDGSDLHAGPKKYIMDSTRRWMDPNGDGDPSDGIDGWRLDVANEVPNQFWVDWNKLVRQLNPEAYTVAEIWNDAGEYLRDCGFSSTMNYHGFAYPSKGFLIDGRIGAAQFGRMLMERMAVHPSQVQFALLNLIDSHDTDRVASMIVNASHRREYENGARFDYDVTGRVSPRQLPEYDVTAKNAEHECVHRLFALFQMTFPGAPMVYYGTEAGMDGGDDPDDRMPMVWDDMDFENRTIGPDGKPIRETQVRFDHELHAYYRDAIQLRNRNEALRRGTFKLVENPAPMVFVFKRECDEQSVLVAINRGERDAKVAEPPDVAARRMLFSTDRRDNEENRVGDWQASRSWELPAMTGIVWELRSSDE